MQLRPGGRERKSALLRNRRRQNSATKRKSRSSETMKLLALLAPCAAGIAARARAPLARVVRAAAGRRDVARERRAFFTAAARGERGGRGRVGSTTAERTCHAWRRRAGRCHVPHRAARPSRRERPTASARGRVLAVGRAVVGRVSAVGPAGLNGVGRRRPPCRQASLAPFPSFACGRRRRVAREEQPTRPARASRRRPPRGSAARRARAPPRRRRPRRRRRRRRRRALARYSGSLPRARPRGSARDACATKLDVPRASRRARARRARPRA